MRWNEVLEEGRREGAEATTRRFVESLLKRTKYSTEEIASLADVSMETVKKIKREPRRNRLIHNEPAANDK
jgi:hypothetical protein